MRGKKGQKLLNNLFAGTLDRAFFIFIIKIKSADRRCHFYPRAKRLVVKMSIPPKAGCSTY